MTVADKVGEGVVAYANAEDALRTARTEILKLPDLYKAVRDEQPTPPAGVKPFGYLEAGKRSARAQAVAGKISELLELVLTVHADDTERCQELGIDVPAPPGTVTPMAGGR